MTTFPSLPTSSLPATFLLRLSCRPFLLIAQLIFEPDCSVVPVELFLVFLAHFAGEDLLVVYRGFGLFSGLFDAGFHPVLIVTGRSDVLVFE